MFFSPSYGFVATIKMDSQSLIYNFDILKALKTEIFINIELKKKSNRT